MPERFPQYCLRAKLSPSPFTVQSGSFTVKSVLENCKRMKTKDVHRLPLTGVPILRDFCEGVGTTNAGGPKRK
jgi:hypothetical protein